MSNELAAAEEIFRRWREDPYVFVKECIGVKQISNQQTEGLAAVRDMARAKVKSFNAQSNPNIKLSDKEKALAKKFGISIRSGHNTGKDAFVSWIFWWLLTCFPEPKGLATAPTSNQLRSVLWGELGKWQRHSAEMREDKDSLLRRHFVWQTERVFHRQNPKEWFVVARTANVKGTAEEQAETLAGMHADYMIMVVDEASGVPDPVFSPLEGAMAGKMNFVILIGQMTRNSGYFYNTHFSGKERYLWTCLHWPTEASDLLQISKDYPIRMEAKYGRNSNIFRIRVMGDPPLAEPDALIPFELVEAAVNREILQDESAPLIIGIDVARYGDAKSIILARRGNIIEEIREYQKIDLAELEAWASLAIAELEPDGVFIDVIGYGAGVYDRLRTRYSMVRPVSVSETAAQTERFNKVRDELWWKVREKFESRTISIPNDEELIGELSTIKFKPLDSGKIKVEGKPEMRKRGLKSPDKADALCLTYAMPDSVFMVMKRDKYAKKIEEDFKPQQKDAWMGV